MDFSSFLTQSSLHVSIPARSCHSRSASSDCQTSGKSTLFQAITKKQVDCANFPFCTIDPNVGVVEVPDQRLAQLAEISHSKKSCPRPSNCRYRRTRKGASEVKVLATNFSRTSVSAMRSRRCCASLKDPDVIHVESMIDPVRDAETIGLELALADLETVTKRLGSSRDNSSPGKYRSWNFLLRQLKKRRMRSRRERRFVISNGRMRSVEN